MARFTSYDEIEVPVTFWVLPRLELHSSISGRTALRSSQREPISFSACFPASCPPSLCLRPPRFPLLFDEKIRPLFGARPASYREKLLVHCNVVTSSSHHSNLKEEWGRGVARQLNFNAMMRNLLDIRCTRLDFRLSVTYLSFHESKRWTIVLLEYRRRARSLKCMLPFYIFT